MSITTDVDDIYQVATNAAHWILRTASGGQSGIENSDGYRAAHFDVPLYDLVGDALSFVHQIRLFGREGLEYFPCIRPRYVTTDPSPPIGDIPLSIGAGALPFPSGTLAAAFANLAGGVLSYDTISERAGPNGQGNSFMEYLRFFTLNLTISLSPIASARSSFLSHLTNTIHLRLSHYRTGSVSSSVSHAGIEFTVHAEPNGKLVYFSPSHFFKPYQIFGAPSSPVRRHLQPGWYIFGQGSIGAAPTYEVAIYDVPRTTEAILP